MRYLIEKVEYDFKKERVRILVCNLFPTALCPKHREYVFTCDKLVNEGNAFLNGGDICELLEDI